METLTFLFTDIEGSTALLRRLGDDVYAQVLAGHHALIRSALAAHGGRKIDTQGDAFFAVFSSPRGCAAAVLAMRGRWRRMPGRAGAGAGADGHSLRGGGLDGCRAGGAGGAPGRPAAVVSWGGQVLVSELRRC